MLSLKSFVESNEIIVAAHRGSSGNAPENTLAAFRRAIVDGAKMIETDVHFTKDGQIVAFHDLGRFAGFSEDSDASDYTLSELKKIDAGSWFHPRFKNERIPTLEEIIELINGKIFLNIELKSPYSPEFDETIRAIFDITYKSNTQHQILFCSFHHDLLLKIKQIAPEMPTAAIQLPDEKRLPSEVMSEIGCDAYICSVQELSRKISNDVMKHNIFCGVYSVDDSETLDYVLNFNINAIGTNNPALINEKLKEKDFLLTKKKSGRT
jgi:glycerophosphoryl diester phosphodiesterase